MLTNSNLSKQFIADESGQGITEYGALLAFVALLIAMLFTQQGNLNKAINGAFQSVINALNSIST